MRYDLHTHSLHSDGALTPTELVQAASAVGLDGLALTDHDATSGFDEARAAGERLGVDVLLGCEMSASFQGVSIHMLAYFIDPTHPRWVRELALLLDDRVARAEGMVERLQGLGVAVTMEQVRAIAKGDSIGRPHVAQAMVDAGVVVTTPDAFTEEWIGDNGRAWVGKMAVSPADSVSLIREAGGVAVIAHPIWIARECGEELALKVFESCVAAGISGIEVAHPDHDEEARAHFTWLAEKNDLIPTASSDFHGNAHGGVLGANTVDTDIVEALRARATAATQGA
jgi:predicted metal-dependent phosphoesterase TrpH